MLVCQHNLCFASARGITTPTPLPTSPPASRVTERKNDHVLIHDEKEGTVTRVADSVGIRQLLRRKERDGSRWQFVACWLYTSSGRILFWSTFGLVFGGMGAALYLLCECSLGPELDQLVSVALSVIVTLAVCGVISGA